MGEDGPAGIKIGPGDPAGEAFMAFQYAVKALKQRGIETAFMNHLKSQGLERNGVEKIKACFIPTKKNAPAREFFEAQGFEIVGLDETGAKHYELPAKRLQSVPCPHVRVIRARATVNG